MRVPSAARISADERWSRKAQVGMPLGVSIAAPAREEQLAHLPGGRAILSTDSFAWPCRARFAPFRVRPRDLLGSFRKLKQRQCKYYDSAGSDTVKEKLPWLLDFCVGTGCANHDVQNSVRWATDFLITTPDTTRDLHILVDSLRNGYHDLIEGLRVFVGERLSFRVERADPQEVYMFWCCLGLDSEMCDILTDLDVWYEHGRLWVNAVHKNSPDLVERLWGCLVFVFKWRALADSRWLTVGAAVRSLVASLAVGFAHRCRFAPRPTHIAVLLGGLLEDERRDSEVHRRHKHRSTPL